MNPIRIGILGCAAIARRSMLPALAALDDMFVVTAIASRSGERARALAAESGTAAAFGQYEALVACSDVDAVYIPLPNALHFEWVMKSLEHGKHVLVEKSLTCSMRDTQCVMAKAQEKGLVVLENFQFRFHSQLTAIRELLASGEIGKLRGVRSTFGFPPFDDAQNIRYSHDLGGGALLDAGAYPVKISQMFLGPDVRVRGAHLAYDAKRKIDLWGGALLTGSETGLDAQIAFGFDNFYQCNLELWGSKGKLTATRIFTAPPGFSPSIVIEKPEGTTKKELPPDNHFVNMLRHFHTLITAGDRRGDEARHNIDQSRLLEQIRQASHE